jgi:F0F1-type ATP synthase delta subunit
MKPEHLLELVRLGDAEIGELDRDEARLRTALENLLNILERKRNILEAQLGAIQELIQQNKEAIEASLCAALPTPEKITG